MNINNNYYQNRNANQNCYGYAQQNASQNFPRISIQAVINQEMEIAKKKVNKIPLIILAILIGITIILWNFANVGAAAMTEWITILIFLCLLLITIFYLTNRSLFARGRIKKIENGDFRLVEDIVIKKIFDDGWHDFQGLILYRLGSVENMTGVTGKTPGHDFMNECQVGDRVYVFASEMFGTLGDGTAWQCIYIFPERKYFLPDWLLPKLERLPQ